MDGMKGKHMMDAPYIREVIKELQGLGFEGDKAKEVLVRYYRVMKRSVGFEPNACNFASEIYDLEKCVKRKYDPNDPNQIYIGDLREKLRANRRRWREV